MRMKIIFKDETRRFDNYIGSYEFIANKFLKVVARCNDTVYTEFYNLEEIHSISIEEDAMEFERRIKPNN